MGPQFKMRCVLWVCGQQVACSWTDAPSGLGVLPGSAPSGLGLLPGAGPAPWGWVCSLGAGCAPWVWVCSLGAECAPSGLGVLPGAGRAPLGLGLLRATLTPGDHMGSDRADGGRVARWLCGGPGGLCGSSPPFWVSPTLGLPPALHSLQGHRCCSSSAPCFEKSSQGEGQPPASAPCLHSVCQITNVLAVFAD